MKEKCRGWEGEVERLLPLEREVQDLKKTNEELTQQIMLLVEKQDEEQEWQEGPGDVGRNMMSYDVLLKRLDDLQETRVFMEEELHRLREERAAILKENANLREGSQPQLYSKLKSQYEEVLDKLREAEIAYNSQLKITKDLQTTNQELHQKLVEATDPNKLKSIQDRMDRYKKERDVARGDLESKMSELLVSQAEHRSALDALESMENQQAKDVELTRLQRGLEKYEAKMRQYREERNQMREEVKRLQQQIKQASNQDISTTTAAGGLLEREDSVSPGQDQYGSPVLDYTPEHYFSESQQQQQQPPPRDSTSPSNGAGSPHHRHHLSRAPEAYGTSKSEAAFHYTSVSVQTKDGPVNMAIQRPSTALNYKAKPQVIVKRSDGYILGTLAYIGTIGGKDVAGVISETRIHSKLWCFYST